MWDGLGMILQPYLKPFNTAHGEGYLAQGDCSKIALVL